MFPLLALAALTATSIGAYQYGKNKQAKKQQAQVQSSTTPNTSTEDSVAKNVNTYNYYTNESENGNTLFGSQKKTKRTLFEPAPIK